MWILVCRDDLCVSAKAGERRLRAPFLLLEERVRYKKRTDFSLGWLEIGQISQVGQEHAGQLFCSCWTADRREKRKITYWLVLAVPKVPWWVGIQMYRLLPHASIFGVSGKGDLVGTGTRVCSGWLGPFPGHLFSVWLSEGLQDHPIWKISSLHPIIILSLEVSPF